MCIADGEKGDAEIHARTGGHRRSPHRDLDQFLLPHPQGVLRKSGWILESPRIRKRNPSRRSDCDPIQCRCATCSSHRDPARDRYSTIDSATMTTITVQVLMLLTVTVVSSLPLANVHVKFVSPPNVYEHSVTTDGDRTVAQKSFISIGRRNVAKHSNDLDYNYRTSFGQNHLQQVIQSSGNVESLWPIGVFLPPTDINDLGYSWQEISQRFPDFYKSQQRDPYLLTGREAMLTVKYLYGLGELFFDNYPHVRALLRNQEERRLNGLHGHILGSINPRSPFHKKEFCEHTTTKCN